MPLMNHRSLLSAVVLLLVAGGVSLLAGCSGSEENPRVTFCRQLAANQTDTAMRDWKSAGNRFQDQEYVAVSVTGPDAHKAVCYYGYYNQEQGAVQMANPMLAYDTVPYQMKVDGQMLSRDQLKQETMAQQMQHVRDVAHSAQQAINQAADQARKVLDQAGGQ